MAPLVQFATCLALLAFQAAAHFTLQYPNSIGFKDESEDAGPCGGFTPDFSSANFTDFHVGGDTIWIRSGHPTSAFLFRGVVGSNTTGNWSILIPTIQENGLGDYCNPSVPAPASFAGQRGLIQVVANGPDGFLYQCVAANFVTGTGTAQSGCKNSSGVTATFQANAGLQSLAAGGGSSNSSSSSGSSPSSSSTHSSAVALQPSLGYGAIGTVAWVMFLAIGTAAAGLF